MLSISEFDGVCKLCSKKLSVRVHESRAERRLRLQRRRERSERNWNLALAERDMRHGKIASVLSRLTSYLSWRAQFHVVFFPGVKGVLAPPFRD